MADSYLNKTFGTPTDTKKYTMSVWVKRSSLGVQQSIARSTNGNDDSHVFTFNSDDSLRWDEYGSSSTIGTLKTNRKFRDTSAWYHVVLWYDSANGTAGDRMRMWINGVEETSFATDTNPSVNAASAFNKASQPINIGRTSYSGGTNYFDGYLSHMAFVDGLNVAHTTFGETDSTSGIWKFKSPSGITWGTNGFHLKFENSANLGLDSSSNASNWTVNGGLRQALDTPSNVYCTMNPLQETGPGQAVTYSFGNTKVAGNWNHWQRVFGSIGATKGKWFYEFKNLQDDGYSGHCRIGWDSIDNINMTSSGQESYYSGLTLDRAGKLRGGISGYSGYDPNAVRMTAAHSGGNFSYTANDILGMAIDLDNETFSVYKNGNLEINAYSYAGLSNNSISKSRGFFIAPSYNFYSTSGENNRSCFNFGNGHFESTAITSAGANGNGSLFEYDVPSNYYAWTTENINTYG